MVLQVDVGDGVAVIERELTIRSPYADSTCAMRAVNCAACVLLRSMSKLCALGSFRTYATMDPKPETWCKPCVRNGNCPGSSKVLYERDFERKARTSASDIPLGDKSGFAECEMENWPGIVSWR